MLIHFDKYFLAHLLWVALRFVSKYLGKYMLG